MPAPIPAPTLMRAARAVFLDAASLGTDIDFAGLEAAADRLQRHALTPAGEVSARLAGANVAICNKAPLDAHVFDQVPTLELVLVTATGVNNIDLTAAAMHGVDVRHCRAYGTASVAQHTLMLMLALHTGFLDYQRDVAAGRWQRAGSFCLLDHPIRELAGQTLGICGRGAIGSAVAELARAFGMRVVFAQLPGRPARADALPWHEFLQQIDVLSLHCPLTEATRHLIDAPALARLRPGAFLVNTARADLVDAGALLDSLHRGHLGGAAFDGLAREPPPPDEPLLAARLPNLVITPHNAWASRQARQRLLNQTVENLLAWRRGEVLRRVVAGH